MNSLTVNGAVNSTTYFIFACSFATVTSVLLALSQIRNRRLRSQTKKLERETVPRLALLETSNDAKHRFLTALSHEIRNPLNGITGLAESMNTPALDQENRKKLALLCQCTAHLASLLDDVLDFSRVQPEAFKFHPRAFDVGELMNSIAALTSTESEKRGIPVEITICPSLPRVVMGDPLRVRQILLNYVYNALKYSSRGKISVTVWPNNIPADSAEIFFSVADQGPGIKLEKQNKLFVSFESVPDSGPTQPLRKTLGLSICKMLAEKINGEVWVESEPGKGSVFYFKATFPLLADIVKTVDAATIRPVKSFKKALVIDDEEYNRIALAGMLEALGVHVFTAAHDRQALQLAEEHDLDLIFVDYSIPGLNGAAIAREIRRSSGPSARAAIFATTAFNTPEIRSTCLTAGMDAFLTKPITPEQLRLALGAIATTELAPVSPRPVPRTPLGNLRLLAAKKGISFDAELKQYFAEFEMEFNQLQAALQKEDTGRAAYYAHLLYGRCSFISERTLEAKLRKIEFAAATGRWDDAHATIPEVKDELAELRLRLCSDDPIVQHE